MWTLVAFGGAFWWTLVPAAALVAVAAAGTPVRIGSRGRRALDLALLCSLAWVALQLVPLPGAARHLLSPHAAAIDRALRLDAAVPRARPLTIAPAATVKGAVVALLAAALFWTARDRFVQGGIRRAVRAVAWSGLAVSILAIVTRATAPGLVYGVWNPGVATTTFGPFVNRNHMGTWLVMALPLVVGYLAARAATPGPDAGRGAAIDTTQIWLTASAGAMLAAMVVSLSRSAAVGLLAAGACGGVLAGRRRGRGAVLGVAAAALAAGAVALAIPRTGQLLLRFEDSRTTATWARAEIWRETVPIVRDFALTGTGIGTYRVAMLVYQTADRRMFFNQAHDQYLQLAAEGGLLLLVPLTIAALAGGAAAVRRLAMDPSPVFWIRAGAAAGIAGVLVQSIWETGLRLPANALLFAMLCAVATHERSGGTE